jgi:hypothetical protein
MKIGQAAEAACSPTKEQTSMNTNTQRKAKEAYAYGRKLEQRWVRARSAERASIEKEVALLTRGDHPKFPGIQCEEILPEEMTCDSVYIKPTNDLDITINTRDATPREKSDPETVAKIMQTISGMHARLDRVQQHPAFIRAATRGPAEPGLAGPPRALTYSEAVAVSQKAHEAAIAKQHQRYAQRILGKEQVPTHPDDHEDNIEEQRLATHDGKRAPLRHVTFADGTHGH